MEDTPETTSTPTTPPAETETEPTIPAEQVELLKEQAQLISNAMPNLADLAAGGGEKTLRMVNSSKVAQELGVKITPKPKA